MKRLVVVGILLVGILGLSRMMRRTMPRLIERMMEDYMPKGMDACFAQMGMERRRYMLSHCRRMLDEMEQKYVRGNAT